MEEIDANQLQESLMKVIEECGNITLPREEENIRYDVMYHGRFLCINCCAGTTTNEWGSAYAWMSVTLSDKIVIDKDWYQECKVCKDRSYVTSTHFHEYEKIVRRLLEQYVRDYPDRYVKNEMRFIHAVQNAEGGDAGSNVAPASTAVPLRFVAPTPVRGLAVARGHEPGPGWVRRPGPPHMRRSCEMCLFRRHKCWSAHIYRSVRAAAAPLLAED